MALGAVPRDGGAVITYPISKKSKFPGFQVFKLSETWKPGIYLPDLLMDGHDGPDQA